MTAKKLTAEELAVKMEMGNHDWADDAADMLRQQQAEIGCYKIELELHKAMIQDLEKGLASSITLNKAQAEIEALKKKLENLPMSLKDDIEYWSEKIACNKCNDTGWVCEWHPDKEAHKCCGGAGMPCECTKESE